MHHQLYHQSHPLSLFGLSLQLGCNRAPLLSPRVVLRRNKATLFQHRPQPVLHNLSSQSPFYDVGSHPAEQALVHSCQLDLPCQHSPVPFIQQLIVVLRRSTVLLHVDTPLLILLHHLQQLLVALPLGQLLAEVLHLPFMLQHFKLVVTRALLVTALLQLPHQLPYLSFQLPLGSVLGYVLPLLGVGLQDQEVGQLLHDESRPGHSVLGNVDLAELVLGEYVPGIAGKHPLPVRVLPGSSLLHKALELLQRTHGYLIQQMASEQHKTRLMVQSMQWKHQTAPHDSSELSPRIRSRKRNQLNAVSNSEARVKRLSSGRNQRRVIENIEEEEPGYGLMLPALAQQSQQMVDSLLGDESRQKGPVGSTKKVFPAKFEKNITAKYHRNMQALKEIKPLVLSRKVVTLSQLKTLQLDSPSTGRQLKHPIAPSVVEMYSAPTQGEVLVISPHHAKDQQFRTTQTHSFHNNKPNPKPKIMPMKSLEISNKPRKRGGSLRRRSSLEAEAEVLRGWESDLRDSRYLHCLD